MGSLTYTFLSESFLFDDANITEQYSRFPDAELRAELNRYREYVISNLPQLIREIGTTEGPLRIFVDGNCPSVELLKQSALYMEQLVVSDPIFAVSRPPSHIEGPVRQFIGMTSVVSVDREELARHAAEMKMLTPLVVSGYLKFFPVDYYTEPILRGLGTYSKTGFSDVLPEHVMARYRPKLSVRSIHLSDGNLVLEKDLRIGRRIAISIRDEQPSPLMIYQLARTRIVEINESTGMVRTAMTLPEAPPAIDDFEAWVAQSMYQTAIAHYRRLVQSIFCSDKVDASFLTTSPFTASLLEKEQSDASLRQSTAESLLTLNLPHLENISIENLARIRADRDAFHMFRTELERHWRDLTRETDPTRRQRLAEDAMHELAEVQVARIEQDVKSVRRKVFSEMVVVSSSLTGVILASGWGIPAAVLAAGGVIRARAKLQEVRKNPSYFLWKSLSRK